MYGEKNSFDRRDQDCPDVAFYGFHHAAPGDPLPNSNGNQRDQSATI
jgi:hypothetical protein